MRVCRRFPGFLSFNINGMLTENGKRRLHESAKHFFPFALGQKIADWFSYDVLWRRDGPPELPLCPYHEMPVGNSGIKLYDFGADLLVEVINKLFRIQGLNLARAKVLHDDVHTEFFNVVAPGVGTKGDEVATVRDVVRIEGDVKSRSFEGSGTRAIFFWVISQDCELGDVTAWIASLRSRSYQPQFAILRQIIHVRSLCGLQWCLSIQLRGWMIRHSIAH